MENFMVGYAPADAGRSILTFLKSGSRIILRKDQAYLYLLA